MGREVGTSVPAATQPATASAPSPLPSCGAVLADLPPGSLTPPTGTRSGADKNSDPAVGAPKPAAADVAASDPATTSDGTVDPAAKPQTTIDQSRYLKGLADVVSAQPGALAVKLLDGPLAEQVVTAATGRDTTYAAGSQPCVDPELTTGMTISVLLVRGDDGTYTVQQVNLFQPS